MLTPQEVTEKTFKQAFVGGYDMPAVDEFLEQLTEDYTSLYKENAVLKNKMKVLVEKLEEYRGNEDSIRQAYLAIRAQAEKELEDTRAESERILGAAREQAQKLTGDLGSLIAKEEKRLSVTREQTTSFINILKECYYRQIEQLDMIMTASMEDSPQKKHDDAVRHTAAEINASVAAMRGDPVETLLSAQDSSATAVFQTVNTPAPTAPVTRPAVVSDTPAAEPLSDATAEIERRFWDAEDTPAILPGTAPDEPEGSEGKQQDPVPDEDLIYSIQQSLTATFNVNDEVDWTPDDISEVRRPNFDFSSLPGNFGHQDKPDKKRGKR